MSRAAVIERLTAEFDRGDFYTELARRVAIPTESQVVESFPHLGRYLEQEIGPELTTMGYEVSVHDNPQAGGGPFLIGRRIEDASLPTVLTYGHADVVRGLAGDWRDARDPWTLDIVGDRAYGRGVVDNKGQHTVNLRALRAVIEVRGALGFNSVVLMETGEETGSPGLHEFCAAQRERLAADILIASDGPRLAPDMPTLFMGTRGALNLDLTLNLRDNGHHSGNWGGLLANPGIILANAIASIVDRDGRVKLRALVPEHMPNSVRVALAPLVVDAGDDGPSIDPDWGEPGLSSAEKVFGWNTFEVLAFTCGNPDNPVNAVPPNARAHCQIRYTVDRDKDSFIPAIRRHLDDNGYRAVDVQGANGGSTWAATRLDPDHAYVEWAARSIEATLGRAPARLPNLGGSLPNDAFAHVLGLPTIYVPHSYAGCSQHAPNEHGLSSIFREGLAIMGGLFWDLSRDGLPRLQ